MDKKWLSKWLRRKQYLFSKTVDLNLIDEIFGIVAGLPLTYMIIGGKYQTIWWGFIAAFVTFLYLIVLIAISHINDVDIQRKLGLRFSIIYILIAIFFLFFPGLPIEFSKNMIILSTGGFFWIGLRIIIIELFIKIHGKNEIIIK